MNKQCSTHRDSDNRGWLSNRGIGWASSKDASSASIAIVVASWAVDSVGSALRIAVQEVVAVVRVGIIARVWWVAWAGKSKS